MEHSLFDLILFSVQREVYHKLWEHLGRQSAQIVRNTDIYERLTGNFEPRVIAEKIEYQIYEQFRTRDFA